MLKGWTKEAIIAAAVALCGGASSAALIIYRLGQFDAQLHALAVDVQTIKETLLGSKDQAPPRHVAEGR